MHQPWASLLVAGIKKHEGRPWYTSHRGRLWIASTAKPVDVEEVRQLEQFYRSYYNGTMETKVVIVVNYSISLYYLRRLHRIPNAIPIWLSIRMCSGSRLSSTRGIS